MPVRRSPVSRGRCPSRGVPRVPRDTGRPSQVPARRGGQWGPCAIPAPGIAALPGTEGYVVFKVDGRAVGGIGGVMAGRCDEFFPGRFGPGRSS